MAIFKGTVQINVACEVFTFSRDTEVVMKSSINVTVFTFLPTLHLLSTTFTFVSTLHLPFHYLRFSLPNFLDLRT
jgi:hypothetical protein